VKYKIFLYII